MDLATAYRTCERITRIRARNFYYGIRLLPRAKRRGLCSVYAFARRVDDVGDGALPDGEKLGRLDSARADLLRLGQAGNDPVMFALSDARERFDLPVGALGDLVDGVEMDVRGTRYERFDDLEMYCRRVAGSIGRLSVAVFRPTDREGAGALADDLGVAMQLTNILRDVAEDLSAGRVYIPLEDRERFGWVPGSPAGPELEALVRFEAARARNWFERSMSLLPLLDTRSAACVTAMTGIYRRILDRIERRPGEVARGRVSVPSVEKAWVAVSSLRPHVHARPAARASRSLGDGS
jgi:15-cis-phytoene synthase